MLSSFSPDARARLGPSPAPTVLTAPAAYRDTKSEPRLPGLEPPVCDLSDREPHGSRPLSALDVGMLRYHRTHPELPMAVGYLLEVEGLPPSLESLRNHVAHRVRHAPELANRIVGLEGRGRGGESLHWVSDPTFDPTDHVLEYRLGAASGRPGLRETANRIAALGISLTAPPWQVWLISGYCRDRFAVLYRASHAQMDGIAATMAIEWLFGPTASAAASTGRPATVGPAAATKPWFPRVERRPGPQALGRAVLGSFGWLSRTTQLEALSAPIIGQPRHEWVTVDVSRLRTIGRAHGATVNDVFLAALAGTVRAWSPNSAGRSKTSQVHVTMPISTRRAAERALLSNYVTGVRIALPSGEPSAQLRIDGIQRQTARHKRHGNPGAAERLFFEATPARLRPRALGAGFNSASVAFTATNIGGLPATLTVVGRPVVAALPMVPLCAGQRLAAVLGGLGDTLQAGFIADAAVHDPAVLTRLFVAELDALEATSLPPRPRRPRPIAR